MMSTSLPEQKLLLAIYFTYVLLWRNCSHVASGKCNLFIIVKLSHIFGSTPLPLLQVEIALFHMVWLSHVYALIVHSFENAVCVVPMSDYVVDLNICWLLSSPLLSTPLVNISNGVDKLSYSVRKRQLCLNNYSTTHMYSIAHDIRHISVYF